MEEVSHPMRIGVGLVEMRLCVFVAVGEAKHDGVNAACRW